MLGLPALQIRRLLIVFVQVMKRFGMSIVIIGLCFFSCRDEKTVSQKGDEESVESILNGKSDLESRKIADFVRNGPAFPIGENLQAIIANFGEPLRRNVIEKQNIHNPDKTDKIYELFFEGLFLQVYHVTSMNKDIVITVEVTGEKYPVMDGLAIGSTKDKVLAALGKPVEESGIWIRYFVGEMALGAVEFSFRDNLLVSIKWNYFID